MDTLSETDRLAFRDDVSALRRITKGAAAGEDTGAFACSSVFEDVQRRIEALCGSPNGSGAAAPLVSSSIHLELLALLAPQPSEGEEDGILQFIENLRQPLGTAAGTINAKAITSGVACLATLIRLCGASVSPKLSQRCYQCAFATFLSLSRLNRYAEAQAECLAFIITLLDVAASQQATHASADAPQWLPARVVNVDRLVDVVLRVADRTAITGHRLKSMSLQLLGKLCECFRVEMVQHSANVLNVFMRVGNRMAEKREPEQMVGEGLLVGLAAYMSTFSLDFQARDRVTVVTIHQLLKNALLFAENASSYRFSRAALHFIELHASTLQECLFNDYKDMFSILERLWCHPNAELHRAAYAAAAAFFQAVAQYVNYLTTSTGHVDELTERSPFGERESKARAVVMDILQSAEATVRSGTMFSKQPQQQQQQQQQKQEQRGLEAAPDATRSVSRESLAYAIVAIGSMAPSIRVVCGEAEVHRLLQLLRGKCEFLLSPSSESVEEVVRLLPHFITAFANMFLQMEEEPQEYVSTMSSILNATLMLYPQRYFFERSRRATVHALTLLFVSLRPHPDLYHGMLTPFVRKSVLLAGSTSSIFSLAALHDETVVVDNNEEPFNDTFVKLWRGLLVSEVAMQRWGYPWSTVCDGTEVDELRCELRRELTFAIVDIMQRLDLRLHAKQGHQDRLVTRHGTMGTTEPARENGTDSGQPVEGGSEAEAEANLCTVVTLGEDHVAPVVSRDYTLVLNLVPFVVGCMDSLIVLEEVGMDVEAATYSSGGGSPSSGIHSVGRKCLVANIFLDAFVALLRRFPFVSGFYTCLAALFRALSQEESKWAAPATLVWDQAGVTVHHLVETAERLMVLYTDDLLLQCAVCITEIPLTAQSTVHLHKHSFTDVKNGADADEYALDTNRKRTSGGAISMTDMTRAHAMQVVLQAAVDAPTVYDRALTVLESWLANDDDDGAARHVIPLIFDVARTRPDVSPKLCRLLGRYGLRSRCQMESGDATVSLEACESAQSSEGTSVHRWTQSMKVLESETLRIPFGEGVLQFPLGALLPRISEMVIISEDRKVRVAAAEEMHAIALWAIGNKSVNWYRPLFDSIVQLASSHDRVVEELFSSLLMQCAHWFANKPESGGPELLDAVMGGVTSPGDGKLRRIASNALIELLRWAILTSPDTQQTHTTTTTTTLAKAHGNSSNSTQQPWGEMVARVFENATHVLHRAALCDRLGGAVAVSKILHGIGNEQPAVVVAYVPRLLAGVLAAIGRSADSQAANDDSSGVDDQLLVVINQLRRFVDRHKTLICSVHDKRQVFSLAEVLPVIFERARDASLNASARAAAQNLFMSVLMCRTGSGGNFVPRQLVQDCGLATDWVRSVPTFQEQRMQDAFVKNWLAGDLAQTLAVCEFFLWVNAMQLADRPTLFTAKRARTDTRESASRHTLLWPAVCAALRNFACWAGSCIPVGQGWTDSDKALTVESVRAPEAHLLLSIVDVLPRLVDAVMEADVHDLNATGIHSAAQMLRDALPLSSIVPVAVRLLLHPHVLNMPSWETERTQRCGSMLLTAVMGKLFCGTVASPWENEVGRDPLLSTHLVDACTQLLPQSVTVRRAPLQSVFAARPQRALSLFQGLCTLSEIGYWDVVVRHVERVAGTHDEPFADYLLREAFCGYVNQFFVHSDPRVLRFLRSACRLALATENVSIGTVLRAARDASDAGASVAQARLSTRSMSCVSETDNRTERRETAVSCVAAFQKQIVPFAAQHVEELLGLCHEEIVDALKTEQEEQGSENEQRSRLDGLARAILFKLLQGRGSIAGGEAVRLNAVSRETRSGQTDAQLGEQLAKHAHVILRLHDSCLRESRVRVLALNCLVYDSCFALNPQAAAQYLFEELATDVTKMLIETQWLYSEHTLLRDRDALRLLQRAASLLRRVSTVDGWEQCTTPAAQGGDSKPLAVRISEIVRKIVHDELPLDYETELSKGSVEMDNFPLVVDVLGQLVVSVSPISPTVVLELAPLMTNPQQRYSRVLMVFVDEALRRLKPEILLKLIDEAVSLLSCVGPINLWRTILYRVLLPAIRRLPSNYLIEYFATKIASFVLLAERAPVGFASMREQTLAFILMETMYRAVDSETIKGDINTAYAKGKEKACVPSGKELTIALIKHCSSCIRGPAVVSSISTQAFDAVREPLWHRQAAYCCLSAALMATQDLEQVFTKILLSSPGTGGGGAAGPGDFLGRVTETTCTHAFEEETAFSQVSLQSALSRDPWVVAMDSQLSYSARRLGVRQRSGEGSETTAIGNERRGSDLDDGFSFFSIPSLPQLVWQDDSALESAGTYADARGIEDEGTEGPNRGLRALSRASSRYFGGLEDAADAEGTRDTDMLRTSSSSDLLGRRGYSASMRSERSSVARAAQRPLTLPRELAETLTDLDSIWMSCCTAAVLELLDFLALKFGATAGGWVNQIAAALAAPDVLVPLNAKFVLARLIALRPSYFACVAAQLFAPLVDIAVASEAQSAVPGTLNYVARETFVTLLGWAEGDGNVEFPANATQRMMDCIVCVVHSDLQHTSVENVELLNRVWRHAKGKSTANLSSIVSLMNSDSHGRVRTGVQVCGIVSDSGMSLRSQDARSGAADTLYSQLTSLLQKDKDLYQECAEVLGMELHLTNASFNGTAEQESLLAAVRRSLFTLLKNHGTVPFLRALRLIATHDTTLLCDFIPAAIFRDFVVLRSVEQVLVLETIGLGAAQIAVAAYPTLHAQFCGHMDAVADIVRVGFYTLLERMFPHLPLEMTDQMCTAFLTPENLSLLHNSVDGRLAFYRLCVNVFVKAAASPPLLDRIAGLLRTGLRDPSAFVQDVALDFLDKSGLPVDPAERFVELILHGWEKTEGKSVAPDENEWCAANITDAWLRHTSILLLSICHRNAAFADDLTAVFPAPLAQCTFTDKTVSLEAKMRRPQHTPLFTQQGDDPAFASSTQIKQQSSASKSVLFTPTALGTFTLYSTSVQAPPSQSKLTFTRARDMTLPPAALRESKTLAEQLVAAAGSNGRAEPTVSQQLMRPLPRRLKKLPEQTKLRLSLMHSVRVVQERKRALEDEAALRRRSVVLFSRYRDGEIPDVQIPRKAFVVPLQALCLYDVSVARVVMNALSKHFFTETVKARSHPTPGISGSLGTTHTGTSTSTALNPSSPSIPFFAHGSSGNSETAAYDALHSQQKAIVTSQDVRDKLTRFAVTAIAAGSMSHARAVVQFSHEVMCMQLLNRKFFQDIPSYDLPVNAVLRDRELSLIPSAPLLVEPQLINPATGRQIDSSAEQTQAWVAYYFLLRLRNETDLALASARHFMVRDASTCLSRSADMLQSGAYETAERFLLAKLSSARSGNSVALSASEMRVLEHERRASLAAMLEWEEVHASLSAEGVSLAKGGAKNAVWTDVAQFVHACVRLAPDHLRTELLHAPEVADVFPVERSMLLLGKEDTLEACVDESSRALCRMLVSSGNSWSSFALLRRAYQLAFIADTAELLLSTRRHVEYAAIRVTGGAAQFGHSPSPTRTERVHCGDEPISTRNSVPGRAMAHLASLTRATPDRTSEVWEVVLACFESVARQLFVWNQTGEDFDVTQGSSMGELAAVARDQHHMLSIAAVDTLYAHRQTNAACGYILGQCDAVSQVTQRRSGSAPGKANEGKRRALQRNDLKVASIQTEVYKAAFEAPYVNRELRDTFNLLKVELDNCLTNCDGLLNSSRKTTAQQDYLVCRARALLDKESVTQRNSQDVISIAHELHVLSESVGEPSRFCSPPGGLLSSRHALAASASHLAQTVDVLDTIVASAMAGNLPPAEIGTVWLHLAQSLTRLIDFHAGSGGTTVVSERLLRLLQVFEAGLPDFSSEAWEITLRGIVSLPVGVWVPWCTQLLSVFLRAPHPVLADIIDRVSARYPQSMFYPYNCAEAEVRELESVCKNKAEVSAASKSSVEVVQRALSRMQRNLRVSKALERVRLFTTELYRLHEPKLRFQGWMKLILKDVKEYHTSKDKRHYDRAQETFMLCCMDCCNTRTGFDQESVNREFSRKMEPHIRKFVENGRLIDHPETLERRMREVQKDMPESRLPGEYNVSDYSLPLADMFIGGSDALTVPRPSEDNPSSVEDRSSTVATRPLVLPTTGELYGHARTSLEAPLCVTGIDSKLSMLDSLQRPKKIFLYTNATRRCFLAKGGDDMRLDQRVLEVFNVVNAILRRHRTASHTTQLTIRTYSVVPMSKLVGLVEWVANTDVMVRMIDGQFLPSEGNTATHPSNAKYNKSYPSTGSYLQSYKEHSNANNEYALRMKMWVEDIYPFYLRDGLMACGVDYASFYRIRERFIATVAPLSISSYMLGIGDRHLSNHLFDLSTGEIIGIDYGHAFGSATTTLPVPEVMPFRFTPQMQSVCGPLKSDAIRGPMTQTLHVMRRNRGTLEALIAAFAQEPLVQWQCFGSDAKQVAMTKVRTVVSKLNLEDPCQLYIKDVSDNAFVRRMGLVKEVARAIVGDPSPRDPVESRPANPTNNEREARFVETLISIATDMNLLGRIYAGWRPLF